MGLIAAVPLALLIGAMMGSWKATGTFEGTVRTEIQHLKACDSQLVAMDQALTEQLINTKIQQDSLRMKFDRHMNMDYYRVNLKLDRLLRAQGLDPEEVSP